MSEPTKGLPPEETIQRWAHHHQAAEGGCILDALCAEVLRLRAELAKASAEVQRLEGERDALQAAKVEEWNATDELPKRNRLAGAVALATSYGAPQEAKDEPPADVLGEAFRKAMSNASHFAYLCDLRRFGDASLEAITELAQVVERIARQQGGGK